MIAASWRFVRLGKRASHHDRVCATGQRLANVPASAHAAIGNDGHVSRGFFEVSVARCRAIHRGGHLGNSESEHTTRSASSSGPDTNQHRSRAALHDLESNIVPNCVSHDYRDPHLTAKFFKIERLVLRRNVTHGGYRALHNENVRASVLRDPAKFRCALRNGTHGGYNTGVLDLAHTRRDEVLLDRFLVNSLQQCSYLRLTRFDNFLQNFLGALVARLHSFQIQNGKSAQLVHRDGETDIHDPIHRAGENRNLQLERFSCFAGQTKGDVHFIRVDRHASGHKRDLVETIGHARFAVSAYPHSHVKCSPS